MKKLATRVDISNLKDTDIKEVLKELAEPFDVDDIDWKPQTVSKNGMATAVAYADPRAYIDRLNEIVGPYNWSRQFSFMTTPYLKFVKGRAYGGNPAPPDQYINGNKLICTATVTVLGMVSSSAGESDAADDNAATVSEAQAFKRSCIAFGLGRYLYDLPKIQVRYENYKFVTKPELPEWAVPKILCDSCKEYIQPVTVNNHTYSASWLINNSKTKYDARFCANCQKNKAGK